MNVQLSLLGKALNFWKEGGDDLYEWFGSVMAISVLASVISKMHPTEVGAAVFSFVGLRTLSRGLTVGAPPVLVFRSIFWQNFIMGIVVFVVLAMVFLPVLRDKRNEERGVCGLGVEYEMRGLLWSRIARTLWVVLATCCQVGPPERIVVVLYAIVVFAAVLSTTALVWRIVLERFSDAVSVPMSMRLHRAWVSSAFLFLAILNGAFSPVVRVILWLFSTESDFHCEIREQIIEYRSGGGLPSGAMSSVKEAASRPTEDYWQT